MDPDLITRTPDEIEAFYERHGHLDTEGALCAELMAHLPLSRLLDRMPPDARDAFALAHGTTDASAQGIVITRAMVAALMREAWATLRVARQQRDLRTQLRTHFAFAAWAWLLDDDRHAEAILRPMARAVEAAESEARATNTTAIAVAMFPIHEAMARAVDAFARSWGLGLTVEEARHVH